MKKGLPRWPMLQQVEGRAVRTQQMIERLDVDSLQLVRLERGKIYCRVHEICLQCRVADVCREWLQSKDNRTERPHFCPNLEQFLSCSSSKGTKKDETT